MTAAVVVKPLDDEYESALIEALIDGKLLAHYDGTGVEATETMVQPHGIYEWCMWSSR
jgi:hypothetical protein